MLSMKIIICTLNDRFHSALKIIYFRMSSMAEEIQKIHDELNDFIMTDDSENVENLKEALDRTCTELDAFLKKPSALSVDK